MKEKIKIFVILPLLLTVSCFAFLKPTITVNEAMAKKQEIDKSENPAYKSLIIRDLAKKRIRLNRVLVKDVTQSGNIDYDFCVIADVPYEKGQIDCFIYSRDTKTISRLKNNKSKIEVTGDFGRFFTLLDSAYTKIEITDASINILEEK